MRKWGSRVIAIEKSFQFNGTFQSMYAAERWLSENGYQAGSTCAMQPTPIMKGDYYSYDLPHKWKNYTAKEKLLVDGIMDGNMREGPVHVYIFEPHKKAA